jgi:hypothetical protein
VLKDNQTGKDTFMCVASLGTGFGMGVKDLEEVSQTNQPGGVAHSRRAVPAGGTPDGVVH